MKVDLPEQFGGGRGVRPELPAVELRKGRDRPVCAAELVVQAVVLGIEELDFINQALDVGGGR
jgi:hypothetical protein